MSNYSKAYKAMHQFEMLPINKSEDIIQNKIEEIMNVLKGLDKSQTDLVLNDVKFILEHSLIVV
jgi:hypothetical protein